MILQKEYQQRRHQLISYMSPYSIAIIPGNKLIPRNGDSHFRFRQQSDFYYLTRFNEADSILILISEPTPKSILFLLPKNETMELWTGERLGPEKAKEILLMDEAYSIETFDDMLFSLLEDKKVIYHAMNERPELDQLIFSACDKLQHKIRRGIQAPDTFTNIHPMIAEMRLFKSDAELNVMRKAAEISVQAHKEAMRHCKKYSHEYELEAILRYEFIRQGAQAVAYEPIVGSGKNTCVLHYTDNSDKLGKDDLVLIDAGCEYQEYASDITRTFPVSGQFSFEQKEIYNLVLKAQQLAIQAIKPNVPWPKLQEIIVKCLTEGLVELGILKGDTNKLIEEGAYQAYYMHNSGHWLGLDVHDAGTYRILNEWRTLQPNMVLTVEPGLYLSPSETLEERWWNIGVRIEDDIRVTENGYENLTEALPVTIEDIEALMNGAH